MGVLQLFKKKGVDNQIVELSEMMLSQVSIEITEENSMSVPIGELAALGGAVASMLPTFRTITETTFIDGKGLYKLANESVGDVLKAAKNGDFWPSLRSADGTSKLARLKVVGELEVSSKTVAPINPATVMMAVALHSIEKQLGEIAKMQKQILSFLEHDKESKIVGRLKDLTSLIHEYKYNWSNREYITAKLTHVSGVRKECLQDISFYQKQVDEAIKTKQFVVANQFVNAKEKSLEKKFQYYRLALYTYALATFTEVMLLGNFSAEYLEQLKSTIEKYSVEYYKAYDVCSEYLERAAGSGIESNIVKGIGVTGKKLGEFIGNIPLVKEGLVDEWLIEGGIRLGDMSRGMKERATLRFETISDAGTEVFMERLDDMNRIYNQTTQICFDKERIYLVNAI